MRQILHVDMDAFFASVEELDNPKLKNHPLAVGGRSDHGVITTANYKARKYGVHSAMPVFMAKKLCPHLVLVPVRKYRYSQISQEIFSILQTYSPLVEKVSIDEAYLDMTHRQDFEGQARDIKRKIKDQTGLTISCGLSYNKFLAKLASDMDKPDGLTFIKKSQVAEILSSLPIGKIHGIGAKSEKKLRSIGIEKGQDLLSLERGFLEDLLGKTGGEIYLRIRGIDKRPVDPNRIRKSIGTEETFEKHTRDRRILEEKLALYAKDLAHSMDKKGFYGHTLTLKVKNIKFETHTRSRTQEVPFRSQEDILQTAKGLLDEIDLGTKLRLMGLSLSSLVKEDQEQLFFL